MFSVTALINQCIVYAGMFLMSSFLHHSDVVSCDEIANLGGCVFYSRSMAQLGLVILIRNQQSSFFCLLVNRIELGGKDQKKTVYGLSEKGMFLNCTARKAQYKDKGVHTTSDNTTMKKAHHVVDSDWESSEAVSAATRNICAYHTHRYQCIVQSSYRCPPPIKREKR